VENPDPIRQELQENLDRILEALKLHYHPEEVIVFGSLASGNISEDSDIDLLIVKDTDKRFWDRIREVISICDYEVGVDFLVYTPDELADAAKNNPFVRDEILLKGKVIYRVAA
jgi:predicted nucleotidyltransferase